MADAHKNFAYSLVATAPSPASSGTSLVVTAADGAKFPAVPFNATIWPAGAQPTTANAEIVRVTLISTDTFTITRAQESSSARTVVIGDQIAATITAKTLTDVEHDQFANTYLTVADETIPASSQVIYEDYLELAASFEYELAVDAILIIGDFATPLPAPDQNPNIFVTVANETIPPNSEVVFSDYYELSAPFAVEVSPGALLQLGSGSAPSIGVGQLQLVYRFTVVGADKATIDTAVDAPDAGSNDWTNCDLLEIIISARTDEAVVNSLIGIVFNNDSGSVYDRSWNRLAGTSAAPASAVGETSARIAQVPGTSVANTSVVGVADLKVPNPTGTAFNKTLSGTWSTLDPGDSTQQETTVAAFSYRPVSQGPLTRLKLQTDTGGQKFKVGSQLLIYKRTAS